MALSVLKRHPAAALLLLAASTVLFAQQPAENTSDAPSPPTPARALPKPAATPTPRPQTATTSSASGGQESGSSPTTAAPRPSPITAASAAASLPQGQLNRTVIVLDPAHGGVDSGSRLDDNLVEKDVTLAFALKLRSLLTSRGFTVVLTRDNDSATSPGSSTAPLSLDDRAGIANHQRPVACLLLHATAAGSGVHLYTSEITPAPGELALQPWLTAQAPWVTQSAQLARQLATALSRSRIAMVNSTASVRPVDSMTCPAVVVELAPNGEDASSISDSGYQQRVASALAGAMVFWQNMAQAPQRIMSPAPPPSPAKPKPVTTAAASPAPGATP